MVPKIANFYWGNTVMPYLRYLTLWSFRKYNPDWKMRLYVPTVPVDSLPITWSTGEHKLSHSTKVPKDYTSRVGGLHIDIIKTDFSATVVPKDLGPISESDFLRWNLLSTVGGLWSDMDILYFRPMSDIDVAWIWNSDIAVCFDGKDWLIGFMMSNIQPNRLLELLVREAVIVYDKADYQSIGSHLFRKLFPNLDVLRAAFPDMSILNLPMEIVYPLDWQTIAYAWERDDLSLIKKVRTIGVHWYAGKEGYVHWVDLITEGRHYNCYNNTICHLVSEIVGD